ncbi:MAG: prepilin-type N-terminal cleavage/methylation domain-containing protein [Phycisphaeraceae bacterium]
MPHRRGLTMVEALVAMVALTILAALLLPALASRPIRTGCYINNTQLRGIHQAMVMYAQGNGGHFPGLDRHGDPAALAVENRLKILLDDNYFTPEYLVSPNETDPAIHEWQPGSAFTADNHSYALLQVPAAGGRHAEWSETLNTEAIVMSDRNTGTSANPASIYSGQPIADRHRPPYAWHQRRHGPGWSGVVVRNDNSTAFETTHRHPTNYAGLAHRDDHLFDAAGDNDAYLTHSGN